MSGILFLCDGKKCENCRSNSPDCMHTSDIKHAVNFKDDGCGAFVEQPAILEEEQNSLLTDLVKELNVLIDRYIQVRAIKFPFAATLDEQRKHVEDVCKNIELAISSLTLIIKNISEVE